MREDSILVEKGSGVEPGNSLDRRLVERMVVCDVGTCNGAFGKRSELLGVHLFDATKTAEFAFDTIEISMVIAVGGREAGVPPLVEYRHLLDTMDRERQPRDPWLPIEFILQVEPGGWRVLNLGFGAKIVPGLDEQVRLLPAHQINVKHLPPRVAGQPR